MAEPYPLVFFPGVMGSRLYFENSGKYWDPDSTLHMLRWAPVWPIRSDDDNRRQLHAREPAGVLIDPLWSKTDSTSPMEEMCGAGDVPADGVPGVTALQKVAPHGLCAGKQLPVSRPRMGMEIRSGGRLHGGLLS